METLRIVAFFVVSLCTTFGIAGDGLTMTSLPRPVEVGQADAGKTIAIVVGQRLSVRLPYVGGTGYSWTPVHDSAALLTFDGASVTVGQAMPGAASEQILTFTARAPGTELLELDYARPWEKTTPPLKRFSITVEITGG